MVLPSNWRLQVRVLLAGILRAHDRGLRSTDALDALLLALGALELEGGLLGRLGLLAENGLGLAAISFLFRVVSALALRQRRVLAPLRNGHPKVISCEART